MKKVCCGKRVENICDARRILVMSYMHFSLVMEQPPLIFLIDETFKFCPHLANWEGPCKG